MRPPASYAEWAVSLDLLRSENNDEEIVAAMEKGTLEWTAGVADRFVARLVETAEYRLTRTADLLTRDLGRSRGDLPHLTNAVLSARRRIAFVMRLAGLPALPGYVQQQLTDMITKYSQSAQNAMEESAKHDRTGKLLSLIRNNAISRLPAVPPQAGHTPDASPHSERPRRMVILP